MAGLWIWSKIWKTGIFYLGRYKIGIFGMFLIDCAKKVLKIYKSIVIENFKPASSCPIKGRSLKVFEKLQKVLLANKVTAWKVSKHGVFSGPYFPVFGLNTGKYEQEKIPYLDTFLKQFLPTESPWKMIKNSNYFILKALFILKIFKFLSWLFDHVEKTAWLER